jgi:hypothetical protein
LIGDVQTIMPRTELGTCCGPAVRSGRTIWAASWLTISSLMWESGVQHVEYWECHWPGRPGEHRGSTQFVVTWPRIGNGARMTKIGAGVTCRLRNPTSRDSRLAALGGGLRRVEHA